MGISLSDFDPTNWSAGGFKPGKALKGELSTYDPTTKAGRQKMFGTAVGYGLFGPMFGPFAYSGLKSLFKMPTPPDIQPFSESMPDLTDQAVREAQRRQRDQSMFGGSRSASFLTGPLGTRSQIPLMSKSILGEK